MDAGEFKSKIFVYQQRLYTTAYFLLKDSKAAEDAVQETYIKLWNRRDSLEEINNLEAFSITIVKNICLDILKSSRTKMEMATSSITKEDGRSMEQNTYDDTTAEDEDRYKNVERMILSLPAQQQQVMILRHIKGYSTEEIIQTTGLSDTNIRSILSRGRKALKELIKNI